MSACPPLRRARPAPLMKGWGSALAAAGRAGIAASQELNHRASVAGWKYGARVGDAAAILGGKKGLARDEMAGKGAVLGARLGRNATRAGSIAAAAAVYGATRKRKKKDEAEAPAAPELGKAVGVGEAATRLYHAVGQASRKAGMAAGAIGAFGATTLAGGRMSAKTEGAVVTGAARVGRRVGGAFHEATDRAADLGERAGRAAGGFAAKMRRRGVKATAEMQARTGRVGRKIGGLAPAAAVAAYATSGHDPAEKGVMEGELAKVWAGLPQDERDELADAVQAGDVEVMEKWVGLALAGLRAAAPYAAEAAASAAPAIGRAALSIGRSALGFGRKLAASKWGGRAADAVNAAGLASTAYDLGSRGADAVGSRAASATPKPRAPRRPRGSLQMSS